MGRSEVAVVGAGITGLSVAWHLLQRGFTGVIVIEKAGVGAGASGVQPGGVRQQWARPQLPARPRVVRVLPRRTRAPGPRLELGSGRAATCSSRTDGRRSSGWRARSSCRTPSACRRASSRPPRPPSSRPGSPPTQSPAGATAPRTATSTGRRGSSRRSRRRRAAGAEIRADTSSPSTRRGRGGWKLRLADGGAALAEHVVVAAGADSTPLLATAGVDVPIVPEAAVPLLRRAARGAAARAARRRARAALRGEAARRRAPARERPPAAGDPGRSARRGASTCARRSSSCSRISSSCRCPPGRRAVRRHP